MPESQAADDSASLPTPHTLTAWLATRIQHARQHGLASDVHADDVLRAHRESFPDESSDAALVRSRLARVLDPQTSTTCADTWIWTLACDARRHPLTASRSFAAWYAPHRDRLARELGTSPRDRRSLADDAVVRFWLAYLSPRATRSFVPRSSIFAMLAIIGQTVRLDEARAIAREARVIQGAARQPTAPSGPSLTHEELRELVQDVLHCSRTALTQVQRLIFERVNLDGVRQADVARELDISPSAVAKHCRLARERLRVAVAERRGTVPEALDDLLAADTDSHAVERSLQ